MTQSNTALQIAPAPAVEIAADERPVRVAVAPKPCPLCFSHAKHEHVEGATCSVCAHVHGDQIFRAGKQRKTVVRHSLPVERAGGQRDGKWIAPAICDDCAWDARRAARKADVRAPRYFDLTANLAEAEARDGRDVEFRAERAAERKAEDERQQRLAALIAKGARPHRDGPPRDNRGPRNDNRRNDGPRRDGRGNPNFGGKSFVTLDDAE